MHKQRLAVLGLIFVALMAAVTVIAHMSCIWLGEACYRVQLAPNVLVESAKNGTWLAPVATVGISLLFAICGAYALAGAGLIRRLPLTYLALVVIGILCVIRGLAGLVLSIVFIDMVTVFSVIASAIWFMCGLMTCLALKWVPNIKMTPANTTSI
ncbi:hypothetical protein [Pseudoalteromonas obscura]|uniref:Uncharacterized protein n=1 Tax=Pseudoalteromonas obscura TaxID=3048491 RepID=A0ABT7EPM3_9GAMM|nr:hypothetical protein [Pseudoalteromonas sp. P94(2023)]MDK2596953.1 hypothetical protein [Pseudoalteromonas sp. P94(2023)]